MERRISLRAMIIRIVKMRFREDGIEAFKQVFEERKELIRHFPGCRHLQLWQDENDKQLFFTFSKWDSVEMLNHYRFSPLFKETWALTKALFAEKAQAWSVEQLAVME